MILQLGQFQFSTQMGYETLERVSQWNWEAVPIAGDTPRLQFARKEAPTLTFSGTWWNYIATGDEVQTLEDLANETQPLALTGDNGHFYGFWVITSLRRQSAFFRPGQHSALQNQWTLSLTFYGNQIQLRED